MYPIYIWYTNCLIEEKEVVFFLMKTPQPLTPILTLYIKKPRRAFFNEEH
jgi:hypothetical protein